MQAIVIAIHGILTGQTEPSWPDKLDAWLFRRDPQIKVLKKEYTAGPFPRLNCWLKNPRLAEAVANEVLLLAATQLEQSSPPGTGSPGQPFPPIWLIAHSNGAHIALLITKKLIARGCWIGGIILTGAACEADVECNAVLPWLLANHLGVALAYCSAEDQVLPWGNTSTQTRADSGGSINSDIRHCALTQAKPVTNRRYSRLPIGATPDAMNGNFAVRLCHRAWSLVAWPYGSLGRTGWLFRGAPVEPTQTILELRDVRSRLLTRWQAGGHSTWFTPENIEHTFEQFYSDVQHGATH